MSWELAVRAIKDGIKLREKQWLPKLFIYYKPELGRFFTQNDHEYHPNFYEDNWEEYKEPKKMVKWYRPRVIWYQHKRCPEVYQIVPFEITKDKYQWLEADVKILEWEEIEAPENFEGCE